MLPLPAAGRIGLYVLLLLAGVLALHLAQYVILPTLIALLLATVLGPAASWLNSNIRINWTASCISVVLGIVLVNLLITFLFSASIRVVQLVHTFDSLRERHASIGRTQQA